MKSYCSYDEMAKGTGAGEPIGVLNTANLFMFNSEVVCNQPHLRLSSGKTVDFRVEWYDQNETAEESPNRGGS
jgi:hypothetical protein